MDYQLFKRWNDIVKPEDEVYHLGDLGQWFKDVTWIKDILPNLNGKKYLIPGNHDRRLLKEVKKYFLEILPPIHNIRYQSDDAGDVGIVLCHYPLWSWEGMFHGSLHAYGHTHREIPELGKGAVHVGVDTNSFAPISIDDFIIKATKRIIS
jgi:calcineurin-like phosphoesterase family protein